MRRQTRPKAARHVPETSGGRGLELAVAEPECAACLSRRGAQQAGGGAPADRKTQPTERCRLPVAAGTPPNVTASHASNFGLHQVRVWRLASNLEERDGWVNSTEARSYATAAATRCIQTIRQLLTACTEGLHNMKPC